METGTAGIRRPTGTAVFAGAAALATLACFLAAPAGASLLDSLRARHARELARLEAATTQRDATLADLARLSAARQGADCASRSPAPPACIDLQREISADQARVKALQSEMNQIKAGLADYFKAKAEDDLTVALRARLAVGATPDQVEQALACILTRSLQVPEVSSLYSDALVVLQGLDPHAAFDWLRKTPGYKNQVCGKTGNECWENENGRISYRTKGGLRIDSSCILRAGDWPHFPSDPADYVRMADSATLSGPACLAGLDRQAAEEFRDALREPPLTLVVCDKTAAATDQECAHASHGDHVFYLTSPKDCGRLDNTIFHEFLHRGTGLDDMTAVHHNDPQCRPYDAIYACSELCFPTAPSLKKAGISWYGCNACARDDGAADRRCSSLPMDVDQTFINCQPRPR